MPCPNRSRAAGIRKKLDAPSKRKGSDSIQWQSVNTPNSLNNLIPRVRDSGKEVEKVEPARECVIGKEISRAAGYND